MFTNFVLCTQVCQLCPNTEGPMKPSTKSGWAHIICTLYLPKAYFIKPENLEKISFSEKMTSKPCVICSQRGKTQESLLGERIKCGHEGCKTSYHITCALKVNLLCSEEHLKYIKHDESPSNSAKEEAKMTYTSYKCYCDNHFPKNNGKEPYTPFHSPPNLNSLIYKIPFHKLDERFKDKYSSIKTHFYPHLTPKPHNTTPSSADKTTICETSKNEQKSHQSAQHRGVDSVAATNKDGVLHSSYKIPKRKHRSPSPATASTSSKSHGHQESKSSIIKSSSDKVEDESHIRTKNKKLEKESNTSSPSKGDKKCSNKTADGMKEGHNKKLKLTHDSKENDTYPTNKNQSPSPAKLSTPLKIEPQNTLSQVGSNITISTAYFLPSSHGMEIPFTRSHIKQQNVKTPKWLTEAKAGESANADKENNNKDKENSIKFTPLSTTQESDTSSSFFEGISPVITLSKASLPTVPATKVEDSILQESESDNKDEPSAINDAHIVTKAEEGTEEDISSYFAKYKRFKNGPNNRDGENKDDKTITSPSLTTASLTTYPYEITTIEEDDKNETLVVLEVHSSVVMDTQKIVTKPELKDDAIFEVGQTERQREVVEDIKVGQENAGNHETKIVNKHNKLELPVKVLTKRRLSESNNNPSSSLTVTTIDDILLKTNSIRAKKIFDKIDDKIMDKKVRISENTEPAVNKAENCKILTSSNESMVKNEATLKVENAVKTEHIKEMGDTKNHLYTTASDLGIMKSEPHIITTTHNDKNDLNLMSSNTQSQLTPLLEKEGNVSDSTNVISKTSSLSKTNSKYSIEDNLEALTKLKAIPISKFQLSSNHQLNANISSEYSVERCEKTSVFEKDKIKSQTPLTNTLIPRPSLHSDIALHPSTPFLNMMAGGKELYQASQQLLNRSNINHHPFIPLNSAAGLMFDNLPFMYHLQHNMPPLLGNKASTSTNLPAYYNSNNPSINTPNTNNSISIMDTFGSRIDDNNINNQLPKQSNNPDLSNNMFGGPMFPPGQNPYFDPSSLYLSWAAANATYFNHPHHSPIFPPPPPSHHASNLLFGTNNQHFFPHPNPATLKHNAINSNNPTCKVLQHMDNFGSFSPSHVFSSVLQPETSVDIKQPQMQRSETKMMDEKVRKTNNDEKVPNKSRGRKKLDVLTNHESNPSTLHLSGAVPKIVSKIGLKSINLETHIINKKNTIVGPAVLVGNQLSESNQFATSLSSKKLGDTSTTPLKKTNTKMISNPMQITEIKSIVDKDVKSSCHNQDLANPPPPRKQLTPQLEVIKESRCSNTTFKNEEEFGKYIVSGSNLNFPVKERNEHRSLAGKDKVANYNNNQVLAGESDNSTVSIEDPEEANGNTYSLKTVTTQSPLPKSKQNELENSLNKILLSKEDNSDIKSTNNSDWNLHTFSNQLHHFNSSDCAMNNVTSLNNYSSSSTLFSKFQLSTYNSLLSNFTSTGLTLLNPENPLSLINVKNSPTLSQNLLSPNNTNNNLMIKKINPPETWENVIQAHVDSSIKTMPGEKASFDLNTFLQSLSAQVEENRINEIKLSKLRFKAAQLALENAQLIEKLKQILLNRNIFNNNPNLLNSNLYNPAHMNTQLIHNIMNNNNLSSANLNNCVSFNGNISSLIPPSNILYNNLSSGNAIIS
ncbi:unnamed protein product [Gordionus sp. m RMFG-2023]